MSDQLRAQLAWRIRMVAPANWAEFSMLWMAFNAIYRGEPDRFERARVMSTITRLISDRAARRLLRDCRPAVNRILAIPPGDLRLDSREPAFRRASQRYASIFHDATQSSAQRLAGVGGVLYQVRCNLIHGGKDPYDARDRMLVTESIRVLRELVPALEAAAR